MKRKILVAVNKVRKVQVFVKLLAVNFSPSAHKKALTEYYGFTLEHGNIDTILDRNIRRALVGRDCERYFNTEVANILFGILELSQGKVYHFKSLTMIQNGNLL